MIQQVRNADVSVLKGRNYIQTAWYSYLLHTSEATTITRVVVLVASISTVMLIYHTV